MIVVLGATGFIGQAFVRALRQNGQQYVAASRCQVDYYNPDRLSKFLSETGANFLVNAAGYCGHPNVDACEEHKAECLDANSVLPGRICEACQRKGIPWGHVSSGCIYTGQRADGGGFRESDTPNFTFRSSPCSFYSGSKALGEEILEKSAACYVWRARVPFNHVDHPKNYLSKLLRYQRLLEATNSLSHLDEFVTACLDCWRLRVPYGTYNLTNGGCVRTSEVVAMLRRTIASDRDFQFFASEKEFMQLAAKTPRSHCVLDNTKALAAGLRFREVHDALEKSLDQWQPAAASA